MTDSLTSPLGVELPAGWELHQISDLCVKIGSGATPKGGSAVYVSDGVNFIRSQNVFDHRFSEAGLVRIDDLAAEKLSSVTVSHRDVLLNITGDGDTIARCCVAPEHVLPARVNQHVMILRPGDRLVPEYLQRYLSQPSMREFMLSHNSGGSRRALTKGQVAGFRVPLPPREIQQGIADVLGALDDKIAVNERVVAAADSLLLAQYEVAVEEDANEVSLSEVAIFHNRRRVPLSARERSERQGKYPYFGAAGAIDSVDDYLFSGPHVLVGEDGSVATPDGRPVLQYVSGKFWVSNHAHVLTGSSVSTDLLAVSLRFTNVSSRITGAVQPKLNMKNLSSLPIVVPGSSRRERCEQELSLLWELIRERRAESVTLAALRDTLLSPLVSGRLRIKDAEKIVEDHV
ncbi:restriction endonuclease subunit S [Streptomyces sp. TRM66268-LWL]|uniref:Restriction endonuclease subunit S n=1 Tax=Streptomyces polyasparticus TaxID=2767826 RepID=A0ABR7SSQ0_9ACTN|nr:restriction endonuclease subunit S [Streptomyces polyasparticus]MBC9717992.1 restriction endonuclease subunit S [Streptomyces polyasparticus]